MTLKTEPGGGMSSARFSQSLRRLVPTAGLRGGVSLALKYGELTAKSRPLPDFLVIGVKKGGTTSLINWLAQQPSVASMFPPGRRVKSPHYFDINYWRGESWYRAHFPSTRTRQRQTRATGRQPVVGESSPYYFFHPAAPHRVRETVPDARLIVSLRDPVSRAYSNYRDRVATGNEDAPTFEAALEAEAERLSEVSDAELMDPRRYSFHHDHHSYLARGRYAEQLERWLAVFPREQLLVIKAEDMFSDATGVLRRTLEFLGLPPAVSGPVEVHNARSGAEPMREDTRAWLTDYYRPHNAALYQLIGEDYGWEARHPA